MDQLMVCVYVCEFAALLELLCWAHWAPPLTFPSITSPHLIARQFRTLFTFSTACVPCVGSKCGIFDFGLDIRSTLRMPLGTGDIFHHFLTQNKLIMSSYERCARKLGSNQQLLTNLHAVIVNAVSCPSEVIRNKNGKTEKVEAPAAAAKARCTFQFDKASRGGALS